MIVGVQDDMIDFHDRCCPEPDRCPIEQSEVGSTVHLSADELGFEDVVAFAGLRPILIAKRTFNILLNENGVADHHVCLRGRCAADSGNNGQSG
jgi:hypothetical protein